VAARALEDVQEPGHVGVDIGMRVLERVAHACLRGEVHDRVEAPACENLLHGGAIREVGTHELEPSRPRVPGEEREPPLLEPHVVIGIEVVEADHVVAAAEEAARQVVADEAGRAGH
jgi:hypothetical protein